MLPDVAVTSLAVMSSEEDNYTRAEEYYRGTTREFFSSSRLQALLAGTGERFRVNFAATPVDVRLERTIIESFSHPTSANFLQQVWQDNSMAFEALSVHRNAYSLGDAYVIAWPDETVPSGVSMYGHDPRTVRVFYDPARPRDKSHAVQVWVDASGNGRLNLYERSGVSRYISISPIQSSPFDTEVAWTEYSPEEGGSFFLSNPVEGILPVFHFRTDRPYGLPVNLDAYGPQDMINKILITMMASVDYAGFPQRYVLTDSALDAGGPEADFGPLPTDSLTTPDEYIGSMDRGSKFESGPGATWLLGGSRLSVGQFSAADSDNFLKPLTSVVQMLAAVTDTPMHYFSMTGDAPSGESYRAANAPLDRAVDRLQASLGATWAELMDYVLLMRGDGPGAQVLWRPSEQVNDEDFWSAQSTKIGLGMPVAEAFAEGGYTRDLLASWGLGQQDTLSTTSTGPEPEGDLA